MSTYDYAVVSTLYNRLRCAASPSSSFNITLNLDTNQVRGFLFKARAKLIWPRVSPAMERMIFPLTQVGNYSIKEVQIINPSEVPIIYHLVPMNVYPNSVELVRSLPESFNKGEIKIVDENNFDLHDLTKSVEGPSEAAQNSACSVTINSIPWSNDSNYRVISAIDNKHNYALPSFGNAEGLHPESKAFVMKAKSSATVKIRFTPDTVGLFKSGLFIRNNLTGVEFLEFYGESVHGEIKFGKFKANPMQSSATFEKSIFEFDMKEKHLKGCTQGPNNNEGLQRKSSGNDQPLFTVKRTFKVKNIGQTSFYVKSFDIEGNLCEGYGFKVLNCEPFNLEPNDTHEVHIAFTPDFTLSKISRRLTMKTTVRHLEALNYTLVASVPSHMLMPCSRMLPRPPWEIYMYWGLNIFMVIILGLTVFVAIFEADRILSTSYYTPLLQLDESGQVFDLRTVAEYVHREVNGNATGPPNNNNAGTSMRYRGQIASVTSSISQGQPLPPGGAAGQLQQHSVQQSPHLVRPPIFTRLLSIVRSFLRSFGIRIWECLWLLPIPNVFAWFSSRKTDRIEGEEEEEEEVGEEGEDHLDKSGAELKGDKKPQQQVHIKIILNS